MIHDAKILRIHQPLQPSATSFFFIKDITTLQLIMNATSTKNEQGELLWNLTTTKQFTVQSAYKFLNNPGIPIPTLQNILQIEIPPIIKILLWLLLQDKLQTAQNLQKKG
jgi:zinc-binding in reverse transcriptase